MDKWYEQHSTTVNAKLLVNSRVKLITGMTFGEFIWQEQVVATWVFFQPFSTVFSRAADRP